MDDVENATRAFARLDGLLLACSTVLRCGFGSTSFGCCWPSSARSPRRPIAADLGPALDADAKRTYRRRMLVLQAEVDDAETAGDPVRADHAHVELDALLRELKRAVGLGGRDRPTGSDAERARVNVVRSLRRTIAAVAGQAPLLGAHLEASVRTGGHCIYLPAPGSPLSWTVSADTNKAAASAGP